MRVLNIIIAIISIDAYFQPKDLNYLVPAFLGFVNLTVQYCMNRDPNWLPYLPIILSTIILAVTMENEFELLKDYKYKMPTTVLINLHFVEIFHIIAMSTRKGKIISNSFQWLYIFCRLYIQYRFLDKYLVAFAFFHIAASDQITAIIQNYVKITHELYLQKQKSMNESFISTLKMIPSGVILYHNAFNGDVTFCNKEAK